MARLDLTLGGRAITVSCADGQERRVRDVASEVDRRLRALATVTRGMSDFEAMALVAISLGDEIKGSSLDAEGRVGDASAVQRAAGQEGPLDVAGGAAGTAGTARVTDAEGTGTAEIAQIVDTLAQRIEAIAAALEQA